jgi:hypothetical protein
MRYLIAILLTLCCSGGEAGTVTVGQAPTVAASYLINEEFGTGSDTNWTLSGQASTHTEDWNDTNTPLSGAASLKITTNASGYVSYYRAFTAQSSVYAAMVFDRSGNQSWGVTRVMSFRDSSDNKLGNIRISDSGAITVQPVDGASGSATIGTLSLNTKTYLRMVYTAGTAGTGASITGWVSSDGSAWGTPQTATATAGVTANAERIVVECDVRVGASDVTRFDGVRVSTSAISY